MSSMLYNPKNQWGKILIPVGTPKTKTGATEGDYLDISWVDTADTLEDTETKKIVSTEALKAISQKFTDTESQITEATQQAESALQKATSAEQKATEVEGKLQEITQGEIKQKISTVTITDGKSEDIDWPEGTALVSCIVDGNTFFPEISEKGEGKANLIFFLPEQKPESFQEPTSAKIILIQPAA